MTVMSVPSVIVHGLADLEAVVVALVVQRLEAAAEADVHGAGDVHRRRARRWPSPSRRPARSRVMLARERMMAMSSVQWCVVPACPKEMPPCVAMIFTSRFW